MPAGTPRRIDWPCPDDLDGLRRHIDQLLDSSAPAAGSPTIAAGGTTAIPGPRPVGAEGRAVLVYSRSCGGGVCADLYLTGPQTFSLHVRVEKTVIAQITLDVGSCAP
jgi:hypothetical protein